MAKAVAFATTSDAGRGRRRRMIIEELKAKEAIHMFMGGKHTGGTMEGTYAREAMKGAT